MVNNNCTKYKTAAKENNDSNKLGERESSGDWGQGGLGEEQTAKDLHESTGKSGMPLHCLPHVACA
jgi:hypothetical protein